MKWLQFDNIETANYYCIADLCPLFEGQKRLSSKLVRSKTPACTLVRFCPKSPFSHFGTREVCPALIYILCLPPLFNHFLPNPRELWYTLSTFYPQNPRELWYVLRFLRV